MTSNKLENFAASGWLIQLKLMKWLPPALPNKLWGRK